ncbi:MAG: hypothetical protein AMJ81_06700 [Phycisphaerae bacterium SM23_33]|nr:MAG: hypothetical protein AMJ81_06700 [Phycisphaerae bacterium SM23_33]
MDKKVRFGVIGSAGLIGNYHANLLREGGGPYQLTALCDLDEARLHQQCQRLGLPGTTSAAELVARDDVDAVIVGTPHPLHAQHVGLAVEAGRDVIVEKPLAATPGDALKLLKAVNRRRRIAGIHYQQRANPTVIKLKEMIRAGELGKLLSIRVSGSYFKSDFYYTLGGWRGTWRDEGGGVLINQAPHGIDLMCFLAAEDMPAELSGHCANLYHTNSQVEDHASATGLFPNGVHFTMNFSVATHGDSSRVDLFGSAGAVMLQDGKFARYIRYEQDLVDFARSYGGPNPYGAGSARGARRAASQPLRRGRPHPQEGQAAGLGGRGNVVAADHQRHHPVELPGQEGEAAGQPRPVREDAGGPDRQRAPGPAPAAAERRGHGGVLTTSDLRASGLDGRSNNLKSQHAGAPAAGGSRFWAIRTAVCTGRFGSGSAACRRRSC